jgi:hypothetical protein
MDSMDTKAVWNVSFLKIKIGKRDTSERQRGQESDIGQEQGKGEF